MAERREVKAITSRWEWGAAAVSGAIVLFTIGLLVSEAAQSNGAPSISMRVDSIVRVRDGHLARITVFNHGAETAADLELEGALWEGGGVVESSTTTLDYLPGDSERSAGLFFRRDPATAELRIRPVGYRDP